MSLWSDSDPMPIRSAMKLDHRGSHHLLDLENAEVALLLDILEAALPAEGITGKAVCNPSLSRLFNELYSGLIDTARQVWSEGQVRPISAGTAAECRPPSR